jgi:DNA modification methylase
LKVLDQKQTERYQVFNGDSCEVLASLPEQSVGYSVFSPPFSSLYTYSNSDRDLGNSANHVQFFDHFEFIIKGLRRVMKPGRNVSIHCMNLPTSKVKDGRIGLFDFRGEIIRAFEKQDFIYHSEVCIWKDPVVAMQRTKALGLLWKQLKKDSAMSRMGVPDYVVTMRSPGENTDPIEHAENEYPVAYWQKVASPIWTDIDQSDTLNFRSVRESDDERHICPLQLDVIKRCLELWSKKTDVVLSPFMGIGSEGYQALKMGRKFVGIELKPNYFGAAIKNLDMALSENQTMFDLGV